MDVSCASPGPNLPSDATPSTALDRISTSQPTTDPSPGCANAQTDQDVIRSVAALIRQAPSIEAAAIQAGWNVPRVIKRRAVRKMDRMLTLGDNRDRVRAAQTLAIFDRCDIARAATQSDAAIAAERLALDGARLQLDTLAVRQQLIALAAAVAAASLPVPPSPRTPGST